MFYPFISRFCELDRSSPALSGDDLAGAEEVGFHGVILRDPWDGRHGFSAKRSRKAPCFFEFLGAFFCGKSLLFIDLVAWSVCWPIPSEDAGVLNFSRLCHRLFGRVVGAAPAAA
jgi:hypothetical protein